MSSQKILGSLLVRLGMDDREARKAVKEFHQTLKNLGRDVTAIGKNMTVGFTAPFIAGMYKAIKAYNEEAQVVRKLQVALGGRSKALLDQAAALQKSTTFADDAIITEQAWAAALGHSEGQIQNMTAAAVELASGLSIELHQAMEMLHKTTTGNSGALGKLIPEIKNMTAEQLKAGEATALVEKRFRGFAQAAALTGTGPLQVLQNSLGDLLEQIGEAVLPIVVSITEKIKDLIEWFQDLSPEVKEAAVAFGIVVAAIGPMLVMLPKVIGVFSAMIGFINPVTLAIAGLAAALIYVVENWDAIERRLEDSKIGAYIADNIKGITSGDIIRPLKNIAKIATGGEAGTVNKGPGGRAQSWWEKGKTMKTIPETIQALGADIYKMLGGQDGQSAISDATKLMDLLGSALDNTGDIGDKSGEKLKKPKIEIAKLRDYAAEAAQELTAINETMSAIFGGKFDATEFANWRTSSDRMKIDAGAMGIGDIMPDMTGSINNQTDALAEYKSTWQTVGDAVGGMVAQMSADLQAGMPFFAAFGKAALMAAAQIAKAALVETAARVIASSSKAGIPGLIIGFAAAVAGISAIEGLIGGIKAPALAQGGLAFGPTMAIVGDNPNAGSDPEVISPLSKLKGMMGNMSGVGGKITTTLRGRDIQLSLIMADQRSARMTSPRITKY